MWKISEEVASATFERVFVRNVTGWERRPPNPNRFFDFMDRCGREADPLTTLRGDHCACGVRRLPIPGRRGHVRAARAGLERHVGAIAAEHPNVRLETIVATHGVIFEQPGKIAPMIRALVAA